MTCKCGNPKCPCGNIDKEMELFGIYGNELQERIDKLEHYLHRTLSHPEYNYTTTTGPRKAFYNEDIPPGKGWERNIDYGVEGWERFDYHEESYWKKKL